VNVYGEVIVAEARRRGIRVRVEDDARALFTLEHGGTVVRCRESLTDRTSALTYEACADKRLTHDVLERAGYRVPRRASYTDAAAACRFLAACGRLVVKPARGEQGHGVTVDLADAEALERAVALAHQWDEAVLLEEFVPGNDLRIIVIGHGYVAAIERRPPVVRGDGRSTVAELVDRFNRARHAATRGESQVPLDDETRRCAALAGFAWDAVVPAGTAVVLRKAANYHPGGSITDVTDAVSPALRAAAEGASRALDIPVVGFDFLTPDHAGPDYVIIEANERPGLANHEPQPVPARFIDFLFPATARP
jgi:GNAT-family acetyltransferase (TIGR03103 family)